MVDPPLASPAAGDLTIIGSCRRLAFLNLARLGLADPDVLGALAAASEDPPLPGTGPPVHFLDGNLKGYAAQALAALDGHLPADVMDGVLHGLARSEQVTAFPMTSAALRLAFPGGAPDPLPAFGELTELQQRVVRILAELPGAMTIRAGHGADTSVLKPDAPTVMLTKGSR